DVRFFVSLSLNVTDIPEGVRYFFLKIRDPRSLCQAWPSFEFKCCKEARLERSQVYQLQIYEKTFVLGGAFCV
ncbi:MAG: hypothetical protein ACTJLL_03435, partial [Anaplasma sp.]